MNLTLDRDEQDLVAGAWDFLAGASSAESVHALQRSESGHSPELWFQIASLKWTQLAVAERDGGRGAGIGGLSHVAEEMGAAATSSPLLSSTAFGTLPISWSAASSATRKWLPGLLAGEVIASPAIMEMPAQNEWASPRLRGSAKGDQWILYGQKVLVPYAAVASLFLVSAELEGLGRALLVVPSSAAVAPTKVRVVGGDPLYLVDFEEVAVMSEDILATNGEADELFGCALDVATVTSVAYGVGLARGALQLAIDYAKTREQFGKVLGSLQGVAFRCSEMRCDIDACHMLAHYAAWQIDTERPASLDVAAAKAYATTAVGRVLTGAHQILAARGFSHESNLHLYSERAKSFQLSFGSTGHHYERIAIALGL